MHRIVRQPRGLRPALALLLAMATACEREVGDRSAPAASGPPPTVPAAGRPAAMPARLTLGTPASPAQLSAIDIDANPSGVGLPPGRGTYREGAAVYASRCAMCHGPKGVGVATFPPLVSVASDTTFGFGNDVRLVKTIGNYWPYATTLYDYIHRAMPFDAPGSLRPNEVYSLVAFLLAENGVIPRSTAMDARTLRGVRMPARDRFVLDDRKGGAGFR